MRATRPRRGCGCDFYGLVAWVTRITPLLDRMTRYLTVSGSRAESSLRSERQQLGASKYFRRMNCQILRSLRAWLFRQFSALKAKELPL